MAMQKVENAKGPWEGAGGGPVPGAGGRTFTPPPPPTKEELERKRLERERHEQELQRLRREREQKQREEEEARRRAEEHARKAEEARRRAEAERRRKEEIERKHREAQLRLEEQRRLEEEQRRRELEAARLAKPAPGHNVTPAPLFRAGHLALVSGGPGLGTPVHFVHPNWKANIAGAAWVWSGPAVKDPTKDETATFETTFDLPEACVIDVATLLVAADNRADVFLNDKHVCGFQSFQTVGTFHVQSSLKPGRNKIKVVGKNMGVAGSNVHTNPGAVRFKLVVDFREMVPQKPAPPPPPQTGTVEIVSGAHLTGAKLCAFVHPAWTAKVPGAAWVWKAPLVQQPHCDETATIEGKFTLPDTAKVESAELLLAADNQAEFFLNGSCVARHGGFDQAKSFHVAGAVKAGANTLKVVVKNFGLARSTAHSNPAGVLFKLTVKFKIEPKKKDDDAAAAAGKHDTKGLAALGIKDLAANLTGGKAGGLDALKGLAGQVGQAIPGLKGALAGIPGLAALAPKSVAPPSSGKAGGPALHAGDAPPAPPPEPGTAAAKAKDEAAAAEAAKAAAAAEAAKAKAAAAEAAEEAAKKAEEEKAKAAAALAKKVKKIDLAFGPGDSKVYTFRGLPTDVTADKFPNLQLIKQDIRRVTWATTDPPEEGLFEGVPALVNVPKTTTVGLFVETLWVKDGTKAKITIAEMGSHTPLKTIDAEIKDWGFKDENIKLEELDKKQPFKKIETPLVATVEIPDLGLKAVSQVLVVLNEKFIFST